MRGNTYQIGHYALLCVPEVKKKKIKKKGKGINAFSPYLASATYLVCLKRYLLNSAQALRSAIMIAVHLDELHGDNPFVKL